MLRRTADLLELRDVLTRVRDLASTFSPVVLADIHESAGRVLDRTDRKVGEEIGAVSDRAPPPLP